MNVTLEFTEEEECRAKMAINGDSAHYALQEIDQLCRNWTKHQDLTEEEVKRLDTIRVLCQDFRIE
jgi:hypothetical protein